MKLNTSTLLQKIKFGILAVVVGLSIGFVYADWTAPLAGAPTCDGAADPACNPPIHVGNQSQTKIGGLVLNTGGAKAGLQVPLGKVLIGYTGADEITAASELKNPAKLDINGQIRIRGGSPGVGKVLVSDAEGLATWGDGAPSGGFIYTVNGVMQSGGPTTDTIADIERCNNSTGDHDCTQIDCKPNDGSSVGRCDYKSFTGRKVSETKVYCAKNTDGGYDLAISASAINQKTKGKLFAIEPITTEACNEDRSACVNIAYGYKCSDMSRTGGSCFVTCAHGLTGYTIHPYSLTKKSPVDGDFLV
jgi:hypothetical protein